LQASAAREGTNDTLLAAARARLADVVGPIATAHHTGTALRPVTATCSEIIELLTNEWTKNAAAIANCTDLKALLDVKTASPLAEALLEELKDDPFAEANLRRMIAGASDLQIMAERGIALAKSKSLSTCLEFIRCVALSSRTLMGVLTSKSPQDLRIYKRYCSNIADIVEDLFLVTEEPVCDFGGFKATQWDALWSSVQLLKVFAHINTARATAKLPNSCLLVQSKQTPIFQNLLEKLQAVLTGLLSSNTKAAESEKSRPLPANVMRTASEFVQVLTSYELARWSRRSPPLPVLCFR
jgi:hypothetical protein